MSALDPRSLPPPVLIAWSESAQRDTVPPLSELVIFVPPPAGKATGDRRLMLPMNGAMGFPADAYAAAGVTRGIATTRMGGSSTSASGWVPGRS